MNICILAGTIPRPPIIIGDGRVVKFLVTTKYRYPHNMSREGRHAVPCTLFDPSAQLRSQLLDPQIEGGYCECRGRIQRNSFDGQDGLRKFTTEVVVDEDSIVIHKEKRR